MIQIANDSTRWGADRPCEALRRSLVTMPLVWERAGFVVLRDRDAQV